MDFTKLSEWISRAVYGVSKLTGLSAKTALYTTFWATIFSSLVILLSLFTILGNLPEFQTGNLGIFNTPLYALGVDIILNRLSIIIAVIPALYAIDMLFFGILGMIKLRKQGEEVAASFAQASGIFSNQ